MAVAGIVVGGFMMFMPVPILASILFPVFAKAREKARQTTCISNQRQISTAVLMYAQDHADKFPASMMEVESYLGSKRIYYCPSMEASEDEYPVSYGFNSYIAGNKWDKVVSASEILMTADGGDANHSINAKSEMVFRHGRGCVVSYADGHASLLTEGQSIKLKD
ncbi:MAG: DUF1559 family PulG-like putative transporter [Armatimonadota bacterium]